MNSSLKCTSISNGSVNYVLKHLKKKKKVNKDPEKTIVLWPVLSLYNIIVGFPRCLELMLLLSGILFRVFQEINFLQPQTNQRLPHRPRAQCITKAASNQAAI